MDRPDTATPTPTVDRDGATFAWHGEADHVAVVGSWCDWRVEDALPLEHDGDEWHGHLPLAHDAYVEYRLLVDGRPTLDPGNRHRVANGFDGLNQQLWMPAASRRAATIRSWRGPRGEVRHGRVTLGWLAAAPRRRRLDLYLPPVDADPAEVPLLVVLDGQDYLERGRLDRLLDGLILRGLMAPVVAAFLGNAGASRAAEYLGGDPALATLIDDVLPVALDRAGVSAATAGATAILGSSAGGVLALHAAVRRPDVFARAICQSVAAFEDPEISTVSLVRYGPVSPARLWLDAGDHEWLAGPNDRLAALLVERGYDVTYRRQHGGHDQTSWTESLIDALPALFPPPQPVAPGWCPAAPPNRPGSAAEGPRPDRTPPPRHGPDCDRRVSCGWSVGSRPPADRTPPPSEGASQAGGGRVQPMSLLQRVERAQRAADAAARETANREVAQPDDIATGSPPFAAGPGDGTTRIDEPTDIVPRTSSAARTPRSAAREALLQQIRERVQVQVVADFKALADVADPGQIQAKIAGMVDRIILDGTYSVTREERVSLVEEIVHELTGLGPIEPYLADDTITEVMVNGPKQVYIERAGKISRVDATFLNDEHVKRIIDRIIAPMGRHIDETSPRVDARLPDGSRVNAIIEPLSLIGPVITIRKFSARPYTVDDLIHFGTATAEMFEFIRACVEARLNIFVSGGTGSGKTTTLNVISSFIPEDERIVTIEDAAELQLNQEHLVTLEARPPNIEGAGEITIRDLLRNALHMRPDRIIVGECRSGEALDMIQAMTTGQEGSLSTGHANTTRDMLRRLETMVLMTGYELPLRAIREQIASAVDVIIHTARLKDGTRKIVNITEVYGIEDDEIQTQDIFAFEQTDFRDGKVIGELKPTGIRPTFMEVFRAHGIELPPGEYGIPPADPKNPGPPGKGRWGAAAGVTLAASKPKVGRGKATVAGGMVYVTAIGPLDPATGMVVNGGIKEHTRQVMTNLKALLEGVGSSLDKIVWVSWSLREASEFDDFNEEFLRWFTADAPGGQGTLLPTSHRRAGFRVSLGVIAQA